MASVKRRRLIQDFPPPPNLDPIDPNNRLKLVAGAHYIPKKNEVKPLGEDALFICPEYQTIGVADGVGKWARQGIDAGEYARELMSNAVTSLVSNYQEDENVDPKVVLNEAFMNSESKGSSTACIVTLNKSFSHNFLHAVNIGDSGFIVLRDEKIVYKSPVQQKRFNCPYQLGKSSDYSPDSAMELVFPVVSGDIVVLGTDGLFDNVYGYEIEHAVELFMKDLDLPKLPELLAWLIGQYALERAENNNFISPFQRAAKLAGIRHVGGKYDDITVVVAFVRSVEADEFDRVAYVRPVVEFDHVSYDRPAIEFDHEFGPVVYVRPAVEFDHEFNRVAYIRPADEFDRVGYVQHTDEFDFVAYVQPPDEFDSAAFVQPANLADFEVISLELLC